jgi:hypothetical protein
LLTVLVLLQSSNLWKEFTVETASDTLLLYALSSLNFIAFVIFGFIFLRSLTKLMRERRTLELGSKIKTRLLLYFAAISILPIVAMAGFSYLFMNRALERWFTQFPEKVVVDARQAVLLEQNQLAAGTSWHAAGLVGRLRTSNSMTRINKYTVELYSQLEQETGHNVGWKQVGSLIVAKSADRMIQLRRTMAMAELFGVEAHLISPEAAFEKWPLLRIDDLEGAAWLPHDGKVIPKEIPVALAKGALALFNSFVFDLDIPEVGPGGVGVALAEAAENERSGRTIVPHLTGLAVNLGAALFLGIGHDRWGYAAFQGIGGMCITEIRIFTQPYRAARRIPVTVAPLFDENAAGLSVIGTF